MEERNIHVLGDLFSLDYKIWRQFHESKAEEWKVKDRQILHDRSGEFVQDIRAKPPCEFWNTKGRKVL